MRGDGLFYARDNDASVVVPSQGNAPYTHPGRRPERQPGRRSSTGSTSALAIVLGTGNPGDDGVGYGTTVRS